MRFTTFSVGLFLTLSIANISNAANPLSIAATNIAICNGISDNGTPMCPAPTPTNQDSSETNKATGNPINALTGNKFESATDIEAIGGEYALRLNRYYNSRSTQRGLFGKGWRSDFEMQLQDIGDKIDVLQADGRKISFTKTTDKIDNSSLLITRYKADKPELGYLERTQSTDISKPAWIWHLPNGKQLQFVAHKQSSIVNSDGRYRFGQLSRVIENTNQSSSGYWSLTYDVKGNLAQVQNHLGDTLKFSYQTTKYGLPKIIISKSERNNSDSQAWQYFLDKKGNLAQVVSPVGERTGYSYTDPNDPHNLTAKYSYDKQGNKSLITKWEYDAYDRAISSTHKDGIEKVTVAYDPDTLIPMPAGHVFTNTITNSIGETTKYHYRFRGDQEQLISVTGAGCATCSEPNVSYEYDNAGRVTKRNKLDDNGQIISSTQRVFDEIGRTIKVIQTNVQGEQAWQSYAYGNPDYPMQPTVISRPSVVKGREAQVKLSYDEHGNVVSMTEVGYRPAISDGYVDKRSNTVATQIERTTTFHYSTINGKDVVTAIDTPINQQNNGEGLTARTEYIWDDMGEYITQINYPEGLTEQFKNTTIAGKSVPTEFTATDGVTTKLAYNGEALPIEMSRGDQHLTIGYDGQNRPIKWQNQLGQTISAEYDDSKQQTIYHTYDGQKIVSQYNTEGQLTKRQWLDDKGNVLIDPNFLTNQSNSSALTTNDYTQQSLVDADLNSTQQNTSPNILNPLNEEGSFNPANTLLEANASIEIETNPLGKIKQVVLPQGATYNRIYDDFGRVIYAEDANTGIATVEYNLNDQPILIQSTLNKQIASYDKVGRLLTAKHCKIGSNNQTTTSNCENIQYTYNGAHLTQITDPTQTTNYNYDTEGRLTVESVQFKDSSKQWQTKYQYDDTGRLFKVGLPEGATLTYQYNDISNPVSVSYQAPAQGWFERLIRKVNPEHNSIALISDIQSDSIRGLLGFTHSNGQTAKAEYDKAGRLTAWQDGDYQKELTYNENGLITGMQSKLGNQQKSETLNYNAFGELINIKDDKAQSSQYSYDLNGNRLAYSSTAGQARYEYEANTDRLLSITQNNTTHRYQYDAAGNPTLISTQDKNSQTKDQRQFSYGARGQLIQYKNDKDNLTNYSYNHAMQRVSKRTADQEERYLWQQGLLDAEINVKDNQETLTRRYIYVGLRPIAVIDYDSDNSPSIYSIHTDHLGTPQQITNDKQQMVWQGEYDAFGNVTVTVLSHRSKEMQAKKPGLSFSLFNQAYAVDNVKRESFEFNLRFAGQYEDSESGYYYNWHRYYDPKTGRYLTSDPIGLNGGLNTYGYAGQNPVSAVDPWGLFAIATWDDAIDSNGRTTVAIDIPILFTGAYKNTDLGKAAIPRWKQLIEDIYTGVFGDFNVCTKVTLLKQPNDKYYSDNYTYNTLELRYKSTCDPDMDGSCSPHIKNTALANKGIIWSDTPDISVAHEAGHMLGINFDPYFNNLPGTVGKVTWRRWTNLMGDSMTYPYADWLMFSVIFDSSALVWKEGKKPEFEPYDIKLDAEDRKKYL